MAFTDIDATISSHWQNEYDPNYNRSTVTILDPVGGDFKIGTVLGKITASSKYAQIDPEGIDGSEVAAGVLLESITTVAATDLTGVLIGDIGPAIGVDLSYSDADAGEIVTINSELLALGIKVKTTV